MGSDKFAFTNDDHERDDASVGMDEKICAYVDGELSAAERDEVEAHLDASSESREAAQFYRWLDDAAANDPAPDVGATEWAQVWDRVNSAVHGAPANEGESERVTPMTPRREAGFLGPVVRRWAVAAALLLAAWAAKSQFFPSEATAPTEDNTIAESPEPRPGDGAAARLSAAQENEGATDPGENLAELPDLEGAPGEDLEDEIDETSPPAAE